MTAGIGLPVGAVLALVSPVAEFPAGRRAPAVAGFVLATAAWAVPGAFALRWLALWSHRRHGLARGARGAPALAGGAGEGAPVRPGGGWGGRS